ncbi:MAG: hypothetical protein K1060chlam5_00416 [Candidatus Anoxychlamydiales bacterium]|nr:hypothetical protein [Candidatus Anoxychlamydiales bacterium]
MLRFLILILSIFSFFNNSAVADEKTNIDTEIISLDDSPITVMPEVEFKSIFFKMLFTLIALIGLILASVYFFKRFAKIKFNSQNVNSNIKILEKRAISPKSMLYLIEVNGKRSLVSESHLEVRKVMDLDSKEEF